jgi:hypothetical protein
MKHLNAGAIFSILILMIMISYEVNLDIFDTKIELQKAIQEA